MSPSSEQYYIILFQSVSHVMKAEKLLLSEGITLKIIPVPKTLSSECGVCIRVSENLLQKTSALLKKSFDKFEVVPHN